MDGRREPTYTCSISRFAPYVRSPSGGHWIFYRIYLRLNRQRIGWSWVTDDSYRSTADREADGSRRWMQSGWLRQQLGDRVGFCVYSSNLMLLDKLCMSVVSSWDGRSCLSSHFWCRRIESSDRIACQKTWWTWVRSPTVNSDRDRPIDTEFVNNLVSAESGSVSLWQVFESNNFPSMHNF